ncbi:MAG: NAD(P)-binding domain-containing protein [Thiohalomonadales bacterium]
MDDQLVLLLAYSLPVLLIWVGRVYLRNRKSHKFDKVKQDNIDGGLTQPASLHPVIDRDICIACNACALACPEGEGKVLALIRGKVEMVGPTHCIGHGACATACPVDAISLVFGTAERGMDIPTISPTFESNVPGIFIAGELGGMGLIGNAITQGYQAMEAIEKKYKSISGNAYDLVIVGSGPAGFCASLYALEKKMKCVTVEQDSMGGTVANFPRGKIVMTFPVKLPIVGKVKFRETTKEILMEFWTKVVKDTGVKINDGERMTSVTKKGTGFEVVTTKGTYQTSIVLMSIGRRGTPRKLEVPGEDQTKVMYRLTDPAQFKGQHVLIVGGGDSALEAAITIADEPGTTVTLSYRSGSFSRAKEGNQEKVAQSEKDGKLNVLLKSTIKEITKDQVLINQGDDVLEIKNEAIIVSAGGLPPTGVLNSMGIEVETKHGELS